MTVDDRNSRSIMTSTGSETAIVSRLLRGPHLEMCGEMVNTKRQGHTVIFHGSSVDCNRLALDGTTIRLEDADSAHPGRSRLKATFRLLRRSPMRSCSLR
jgi:hypothetical protein